MLYQVFLDSGERERDRRLCVWLSNKWRRGSVPKQESFPRLPRKTPTATALLPPAACRLHPTPAIGLPQTPHTVFFSLGRVFDSALARRRLGSQVALIPQPPQSQYYSCYSRLGLAVAGRESGLFTAKRWGNAKFHGSHGKPGSIPDPVISEVQNTQTRVAALSGNNIVCLDCHPTRLCQHTSVDHRRGQNPSEPLPTASSSWWCGAPSTTTACRSGQQPALVYACQPWSAFCVPRLVPSARHATVSSHARAVAVCGGDGRGRCRMHQVPC